MIEEYNCDNVLKAYIIKEEDATNIIAIFDELPTSEKEASKRKLIVNRPRAIEENVYIPKFLIKTITKTI